MFVHHTQTRLGIFTKKRWCVLTSKQVEVFRIEQLEAKKRENDFYRERAAVHKVTIKQLRA